MKINKFSRILLGFFLTSGMIMLFLFFKYHDSPQNVEKKFVNEDIIELNPVETFNLNDLDIGNITCTGLTFDSIDKSFWIADYGAQNVGDKPNPRLIEVNETYNKVLKIIKLNDLGIEDINLQGISYNINNNNLYIATGNYILEITKDGVIKNKIENNLIGKYKSNGIAYNEKDGYLWSLLYSKYLIQLNTDGEVEKKVNFNYKDQDQIYIENNFLYSTIGASYSTNDNFVLEYNLNNANTKLYRVNESYAIEGIFILNGKMYIANDGVYHNAKIKKNYINVYNMK